MILIGPRSSPAQSMTRFLICIVVLGFPIAAAATAADGEPRGEGPWVGFGGVYRTGSWTPLTVEVREGEGPVYASVEDPDGQWVASPPAAIRHVGDRSYARFCVRFGRPSGRVLIHHTPLPAATAARVLLPPVPSTDIILLVLGDPAGIDRAARLLAREDGGRPRVVVAPGAGAIGRASP
jgi:hypothetical protein